MAAGIADVATLAALGEGFLQWREDPAAFAAEAWGEVVAWKSW